MSTRLHELDRRELFFKLVCAQDEGVGLKESRSQVAGEFRVDVEQVCDIEREGLAKHWPPLRSDGH